MQLTVCMYYHLLCLNTSLLTRSPFAVASMVVRAATIGTSVSPSKLTHTSTNPSASGTVYNSLVRDMLAPEQQWEG